MKLKSAVFLNALNAAFTHLKTKMTPAQLAKLKLKAEQGNFLLFSELASTVAAADGRYYTSSKHLLIALLWQKMRFWLLIKDYQKLLI